MSLAEDIVRQVDIVDYISKRVPLKKNASNRVGNCPFHKEKTPSFMVSDSKGIFKCFGCGKGGDVITFVMEYERLDFMDTLKYLAEYAHIDINKYEKIRTDPRIKQSKEETKSINQEASLYFQDRLRLNTHALEYLHTRQLNDQIINTFQLGYASDDYYELINYLKKKDVTIDQMVESGLCKTGPSGDIYNFFRKRIIFPIWDQVGNVIAFTGRVLDPQDTPKYLNITNTTLYDKSKALYGINFVKKHINEHHKIIVVEGNMDVIALHRIGLPIGVATCGTSLTHDHIKIIQRHTDQVYFLFDNDDAGFNATIRALKIAYEHDIYPQILQLHHPLIQEKMGKQNKSIKDIDDFANAGGTAQELLATAKDGLHTITTLLTHKYSLTNPVEKKKITTTLFEIIKPIQDMSIVQHYLSDMSQQLGIGEQVLLAGYKTWYKQNRFGGGNQEQGKQEQKEPIDTMQLVEAMITNTTWKDYADDALIDSLVEFYLHLQSLVTQDQKSGSSYEQGDHKSMILWWERELDGMNKEKRIQFIKSMILKPVDQILKTVMKVHTLTPEEKSSLYQQRKQRR